METEMQESVIRRRVGCLGPSGSYSELAAKRLCGGCEIVLYRDFVEVLQKLARGETDYAVLPVENSIQGSVFKNIDLIWGNGVFATGEIVLGIDHRLAMLEGVGFGDVKRIYSHEQAIGQCASFLREHFPEARCIFTRSTAESLSLLDERSAGIVGAHISREGVVLSGENIADEKQNFTRFMLLERPKELPATSRKIYFCAVTPHRPGALAGLLKVFADSNLNLTRIGSRPIRNLYGRYRFFVEFTGDIGNSTVREALKKAENVCESFRLLGVYD